MIQNITETKPLRDSDFDISVLNFCNEIAKIFSNSILPDNFDHKLYDQIKKEKENHLILANDRVKREQYLKYLRFKEITNVEGRAGFAFGPNLLQQKALVTRGKGAKNPFSNRNHRWHPLIAAKSIVQNLSKIEKITTDEEYFVRGRGKKKKKFKSKTLVFHIKQEGQIKKFKSSETFKINGKFVVTPEKWDDIHEEIKLWTNEDWKFAKCLIPATEACEWYNAVESYCILGIIWG